MKVLYRDVVTMTTRKPRIGEENGKDYHFQTEDNFLKMIEENMFVEHVSFSGNRYGLPKTSIQPKKDEIMVLIVEDKGYTNIKNFQKENPWLKVKTIFLDIEQSILKENMLKRGDSLEMIEKRISTDNISKNFNKLLIKKKDTSDILIIKELLNLELLKTKVEKFILPDTNLLLLVGPSGSGKDSLKNHLLER